MALHIDGHPAYIAWQRQLFTQFELDYRDRVFSSPAEKTTWLQARAADINGFKAYVQTELMKPSSPLALMARDLPDAATYEGLPKAQRDAIRAQFDAIKRIIRDSHHFRLSQAGTAAPSRNPTSRSINAFLP
jgi:hypothetical protein